MRRTRSLLAAVAVGAGVITSLAVATPATAAAHDASAAVKAEPSVAQRAATRQKIIDMVHAGATDAQLKSSLHLVRVGHSDPAPMSSNTISIATPQIYYDSDNRFYYVMARWSYVSTPDGLATSGDDKKVGGADQWDVAFSRTITNLGASLEVYPLRSSDDARHRYNAFAATNYFFNSSAGSSWSFQDRYYRLNGRFLTDYNFRSGLSVFDFKTPGCVQVYSRMDHTWSNTAVASVSIGLPAAVNVQFVNQGYSWGRASAAGTLGC